MENINTQLIEATQEYLRSDKLKEVISSQAEKMVNEVISDAFKWNGIIKTQLEKEIKENLSLNIKELGVSGHNKFITEVVKDKLHQFLRHDVEVEITKSLEEMLKPIDKIVSIERIKQELFKASDKDCVDSCCDDMDYILENYDEDDLFTFNFEHPEGNYKWVNIFLDKEPGKSNYECEFKLCVHETFTTFKQNDREMTAKDKIMNPYKWDIEGFIYQMFLAGSIINYEEAKAL